MEFSSLVLKSRMHVSLDVLASWKLLGSLQELGSVVGVIPEGLACPFTFLKCNTKLHSHMPCEAGSCTGWSNDSHDLITQKQILGPHSGLHLSEKGELAVGIAF